MGSAMASLEAMIAERGSYPYAERLLANLYYQEGLYSKSVHWYRIYLAHSEMDDRTRLWLAKSLAAQGQIQAADAVVSEILLRHPNYREALRLQIKWMESLGLQVEMQSKRLQQLDLPGSPAFVVHKR